MACTVIHQHLLPPCGIRHLRSTVPRGLCSQCLLVHCAWHGTMTVPQSGFWQSFLPSCALTRHQQTDIYTRKALGWTWGRAATSPGTTVSTKGLPAKAEPGDAQLGTSLPQVPACPQFGAEPPPHPCAQPRGFPVIVSCSFISAMRFPRCLLLRIMGLATAPDKLRITIGLALFSVTTMTLLIPAIKAAPWR